MTSILTTLNKLDPTLKPDQIVTLIRPAVILPVAEAFDKYPDHQCYIIETPTKFWRSRGDGVTKNILDAHIYTVAWARGEFSFSTQLKLRIIL